ncbi:endonuclease/exonuclease/phosphatase family protein [Pedobacter sp. Hv1]|uniref:endonuclease/exonuclease/phosphatase family protein n=1 Tax=Pedobacter sp. Hv1 TaxID=1740090 RepID=UPI0006D8CC8A|nr:endonuclease/exonuclease/phosphatase family protein [Pedobacter sp. Hv1]KQB99764.1 endonuclease [Pedobacter sp. Hv1]
MKKKKLTLLDKLMILVAIAMAVGLICGVLAGKNDPRQHIVLAFFGLAYPFFLLANFIVLFWWVIRSRWIFSLATLVVIFSGWSTLIATFGLFGNIGDHQKEEAELVRMMTYNVHNFKPYGDKNTIEVKEKMLNVVKEQNPDVICFQEFYTRFKGPYDTVDSLMKLLNTSYYYFQPTMRSRTEAIGLAIFSKHPIEDRGNIVFEPGSGNESIYVDLNIKGNPLRIYNVHLQSISFEKEDYTYIDKVKEMDAPKVGSSKRIAKMLREAFKKRSAQVDLMKAHMKTCKTPYLIAGDFNDTPASYAVTKMTDSLNNAFVKQGRGLGRTYNGKFPNFQIDYIATTPDIEITNYHIIEAKLSDHFPVRSDLRLKSSKP